VLVLLLCTVGLPLVVSAVWGPINRWNDSSTSSAPAGNELRHIEGEYDIRSFNQIHELASRQAEAGLVTRDLDFYDTHQLFADSRRSLVVAKSNKTTSATNCSVGSAEINNNQGDCWCIEGYFSVRGTGVVPCTQCPTYTTTTYVGAIVCVCAANAFSANGSYPCVACPSNSYAESTSSTTCTCSAGRPIVCFLG
jgi:hypothetical protein